MFFLMMVLPFAFEQAQEAARDPQAEAVQQASADARLDQTTLGNPLGLNSVDDFLGQGGVQTTGLSDEQAQRFVEAVSKMFVLREQMTKF